MMKLGELAGQKLKWIQPRAFKLEYELRAGSKIVATLRYPHCFDTFAIASSGDGTWTFRGGDFRQPAVSIRAFEAEIDLAVFKSNIWAAGGMLELPTGRKYQGQLTGRGHEYNLRTETGEMVVSYRKMVPMLEILRMSADTQIYHREKDLVEMPWIVMLGWHLILVM
jgi:hypothetical protein